MDKFVSRSQQPRRAIFQTDMAEDEESNMASPLSDDAVASPGGHGESPIRHPSPDHQALASSVAAFLKADIISAIAEAIQHHLGPINAALDAYSARIGSVESRVDAIEHSMQEAHSEADRGKAQIQFLLEKVDDLENRARRNNLRIVGLPESVAVKDLPHFCSTVIPQALGLKSPCTVERAHRLGPMQHSSPRPRSVIVRFLDFNDRQLILQSFRTQRQLLAGGYKLLLFADYSAALSKRRKQFSEICRHLVEKKLKFTLAYPATLRIVSMEGTIETFHNPSDAHRFLQSSLCLPEGSPSKSPPRKKTARNT